MLMSGNHIMTFSLLKRKTSKWIQTILKRIFQNVCVCTCKYIWLMKVRKGLMPKDPFVGA